MALQQLFASLKAFIIWRILIIAVFIGAASFICVIEGILYVTLRPWSHRIYRKIDYYLASHIAYPIPVFLFEWWSGTRFELIADPSVISTRLGKEHALILPNHKHSIDWLLMFPYANHFGVVGNLRVFSKKSVQYYPPMGLSWKLHENPLLERNWEQDKLNFGITFADLMLNSYPGGMLVLFPEGTRFTEKKHQESMAVARAKGVPELKHHLLPRTRGFVECMKVLRSEEMSSVPVAVYDALVIVSRENPMTFMSVFRGEASDVKILLRRYPVVDIPEDEQECANWLQERFREKDKMLDNYFRTGEFARGEEESAKLGELESIVLPKRTYILVNFVVFAVLTLGLLFQIVGTSLWTNVILFGIGYVGLKVLDSANKIEKGSSYGLRSKQN